MLVDIDVRAVLPSIAVPTLIIHRDDDAIAPIEGARHMAAQLPGARLVELSGEQSPIMFTDIVGSTSQVAAMGDRRWTELLEDHYQLVRRQLQEFGGQEIQTIGDEFLATFDGPAHGACSP